MNNVLAVFKQQYKIDQRTLKNLQVIEQIDKLSDLKPVSKKPEMKESMVFFRSIISLTNWHDEVSVGSAMGMLIKISSTKLNALGIKNESRLENITTTFYPIVDYITYLDDFFTGPHKYGNINGKNIIRGNAVGDGNAVYGLITSAYSCFGKISLALYVSVVTIFQSVLGGNISVAVFLLTDPVLKISLKRFDKEL